MLAPLSYVLRLYPVRTVCCAADLSLDLSSLMDTKADDAQPLPVTVELPDAT